MEVILLEKIRNLGVLGDKVKVKSGFARNYLVPKGMAVYATKANIGKFEERRAELEELENEKHQKALARQQTINALAPIVLSVRAGEDGKLFGSIGTRDISEALSQAGVTTEKREIRLPEGALRRTGEYDIVIELDSEVEATVKINIVGEG